jgi:hypothetical protein
VVFPGPTRLASVHQILEGMDSFVTGCDGMTESGWENADNPLLGEFTVSVGDTFLIDGLMTIDLSTGFAAKPFGGVTPVFAVGSNLITGGVFILLACKACKNGGSRDTLDMEEIIAGGSGSMLYGSAHSFPLDVRTGVTAGVINLDECEDLVSLGLRPLGMFCGGILAGNNSCSYRLLVAKFSGGTRPNSKVE